MPKFLKSKNPYFKKSRTSKTTSHDTSDSAHIGLHLNNKAINYDEVEVQDVRSMGRDIPKKMGSYSASRSASSAAADHSLVDALLSKFTQVATTLFSSRNESSSEYLRIKGADIIPHVLGSLTSSINSQCIFCIVRVCFKS
nr:hypothetical protein [Tanacetum cinerariifolium]